MSEHGFDVIVRHAAGLASRRATLLTLSTAGVAALAQPLTARAKKNKKKSDKKDKQQCKKQLAQCTAQVTQCTAQVAQSATQVEQCNASVTTLCAGDPACTERINCCPVLGSGDVNAFLTCIGNSGLRRVP